jgi:LytS/YehU family sensor histidine kinase
MSISPIRPTFWPLQLLGWTGYFIISLLSALAHGKDLRYYSVVLSVTVTGMVLTTLLHVVLRRIWQYSAGKLLSILLPMFLVIVLTIGMVTALAIERYCPLECKPSSVLGYFGYSGVAAYIVLAWIAFWFGIRLQGAYSDERKRTLMAQAQAHDAQLKMLRYQLNPHFLFNTLNAIATLVLDRSNEVAERMLAALSRFLRYTLDQEPQQKVPLKRELEILDLYLRIEQMRFAERLRLDFKVDSEVENALVPSLILQPLVENAIKYAVAKKEQGCTLSLRARKAHNMLELEFMDDGPGCAELALQAGVGVGLRNSRERLNTLYGSSHQFRVENRLEGGVRVAMSIPFQLT